jgi:ribosomal protein S18 acetylase RimI-like enzyme
MESLTDWSTLQRFVGAVPRTGDSFSTNLYGSREQIEKWSAAAPLQLLQADGALLLLRTDRDFRHVYHVARDSGALTKALLQLPPGLYSTDLIGQGEPLDRVCKAHAAGSFAHYGFLRRMSRVRQYEVGDDKCEQAASADVRAVAALLDRLLDPFVEQLPEIEELAEAAFAGRLLVVRAADHEISGMLMYDVKGQLAHLRFWHVDGIARGQGVGRRLMASFLSRCGQLRRITLWVIGDNARSIAIYRHYGFAEDGLLDRIMVLHKD